MLKRILHKGILHLIKETTSPYEWLIFESSRAVMTRGEAGPECPNLSVKGEDT
jgi:hypothetical protein